MNLYELTYLISPELTGDEAEKYSEEIIEKVKNFGITLHKIENPKRKVLAYDVKKFNEAYLTSFDFDAPSDKIKDIEVSLMEEGTIIRFILISKLEEEEKEEEPELKEIKKNDEVSLEDDLEEKEIKEEENDKETIDNLEKESDKVEEEKPKRVKKVKLKEIDDKIDEIL